MFLFIKIYSPDTHHYYDLFYFLAILFSLSILIYKGIKEKHRFVPWTLTIYSILLFLIIGTKIFTLRPVEWMQLFSTGQIPNETGRTILGGLAGCVFAIIIGRLFLGFKFTDWKVLAYIIPGAMAIQRIGCLLAGCCYGTPTDLPWAIQYGLFTRPHADHYNNGFVNLNDPFSLPIHPNPLYQILGCLLILFIIHFVLRKKIKQGSLLPFSILLYLVLRGVIEFYRAEGSNGYAGQTFLGLKLVQWITFGAAGLFAIYLFFNEKYGFHYKEKSRSQSSSQRILIYFLFLIFITILIWNWLPGVERALLFFVISIFSLAYFHYFLSSYLFTKWRFYAILIIPVYLFFSGWQEDSLIVSKKNKGYLSLQTGYLGGKYDFTYIPGCQPGNCCSGPLSYARARYDIIGLGIGYTKQLKKERTLSFFFNFSGGAQTDRDSLNIKRIRKATILTLNPRLNYNGKWLGIGLGVNGGVFYQGYWESPGLPYADIRIGVLKYFFASLKYADQFPGVGGRDPYRMEIGSGFGQNNFTVKFGKSEAGLYLRPTVNLLKNKIFL